MQIFKICEVSNDFSSKFLINWLELGSAPEPPTNGDLQNFLNFCPNFRENFDKIWKIIKMAKFPLTFSKVASFHWFSTKIIINSLASGLRLRTRYQCMFLKFWKFLPKFSGKIFKNLKNYEKLQIFLQNYLKNWKLSRDFFKNFENISGRRVALQEPLRGAPLQAFHWWTSPPPPQKNSCGR